mmetsp:Transcript_1964/g.4838  ORF Transcript_1964/g.4838 Transcript_1964/m.4838 type:complete len:359 (+) Transcript_1964:82-1158(+)|eukprot:CAMPEP_0119565136 /NCGR_PEP_ID=MMETSP1352-20130426/29114_1 /TAXON_ID=265584 /ORGANISM="Stauroneis constricta, Strain CCMP1120" /LENGTH=358 /DNA_ID=CAMNT_0007613995 /DNA_START=67 /DNA_END=1143 /DNA_ORIENTATION=-
MNIRRLVITLVLLPVAVAAAWQWSDFLGGSENVSFETSTLTFSQVSEMRVRDLRRRLTRRHGYSAEEVGRVLDKKELIQILSFEEHKERDIEREKFKRAVTIRGIMVAVLAVLVAFFWPLLQRAFEVASVNFVVYTDRKKYETRRCFELRSVAGFFGIALMAILDVMQLWLSTSVLLSWVMTSKFFFPTPKLTVNPAKMMGGDVAKGPMGQFGLNVGPMVLTWAFRFVYARIESWTGRALSRAHQQQKQKARAAETPEEKAARKAARKAAKRAAKAEKEEELRKRQEEERERRREAAQKATDSLFPDLAGTANRPQQQQQQNGEEMPSPQATGMADEQSSAFAEFQKQMEEVDMDELD